MAVQRIVRANYTIPAGLHLSEQCLDLVRRIFVVAPTERITLEGIQQHPWFLQNLPLQLQVCSRPSPGPRLPMRPAAASIQPTSHLQDATFTSLIAAP